MRQPLTGIIPVDTNSCTLELDMGTHTHVDTHTESLGWTMSQMLTGVFPITTSSHTLDLEGSLALCRGSQGWTHCRIPDTNWGITSGMGMLSSPASSHQFPRIRTCRVIGIQPLSGVLPVDTSSHIPELVRSLVWRPGGDPPAGHQTEVQ